MAKKTFKSVMGSKAGGYIVITVVFLALLCLYPGANLFTWIKARTEISSQRRQIRKYQREIIRMNERIEALTSDTDTLEKFARERFHFAEPGDDVYLLEK